MSKREARKQIRNRAALAQRRNERGVWVDARWYEALGRDTVHRMLAEFGFDRIKDARGVL